MKVNKTKFRNTRQKILSAESKLGKARLFCLIMVRALGLDCSLWFVRKYFGVMTRILRSNGVYEVVVYNKKIRQALQVYLLGGSPPSGIKLKRGLPVALPKFLRDQIRTRNISYLRIATTMISWTKSLVVASEPSFITIAQPSNFQESFLDKVKPFVSRFIKIITPKDGRLRSDWISFHFTARSGPAGQALWTWYQDYKSILMVPGLKEDIIALGGKEMRFVFDNIRKETDNIDDMMMRANMKVLQWPYKSQQKMLTRILTSFGDNEDKVREIAILDYFSQTVLRPIHLMLFKLLKEIPNDYTFDQGGFLKRPDINEGGTIFYSCDLTAATDRFPIKVIKLLLVELLGEERANAWYNLMVKYPFIYTNHKGDQVEISYSVGNPMGAYSSWSSFTLAHHFVMFLCCLKTKIPFKKSKYFMLGDDIVIYDTALYNAYREILVELDVPVSEAKTHISPSGFEFAKRLFIKDKGVITEFSPIPLKGIINNFHDPFIVSAVMYSRFDKGYGLDWVKPFVLAIYKIKYGDKVYQRIKPRLLFATEIVMYLYLIMSGKSTFSEFIPYGVSLVLGYDIPFETQHLIEKHNLLELTWRVALKEYLYQSMPTETIDADPAIREILMNDIRGYQYRTPATFIPILDVYKQMVMRMMNHDGVVDEALSREDMMWPLRLKGLQLPTSGRVFYYHQYETLRLACTKVVPIWKKILEDYISKLSKGEPLQPQSPSSGKVFFTTFPRVHSNRTSTPSVG